MRLRKLNLYNVVASEPITKPYNLIERTKSSFGFRSVFGRRWGVPSVISVDFTKTPKNGNSAFTLVPNAFSTNRSFLQLSSKSTSIDSSYHPLFIFTLISSTLSKLHSNILTHTNSLSTHIPSHIHIHTILCHTIHISSAITHHHSSRII